MPGWAMPGAPVNPANWSFGIKRGWTPPGAETDPGELQYEMPPGAFPGDTTPQDWHMLVSPPGTQAPADAINYTPQTREIHPAGETAPAQHLNLSMVPVNSPYQSAPRAPDVSPMQSGDDILRAIGLGAGGDRRVGVGDDRPPEWWGGPADDYYQPVNFYPLDEMGGPLAPTAGGTRDPNLGVLRPLPPLLNRPGTGQSVGVGAERAYPAPFSPLAPAAPGGQAPGGFSPLANPQGTVNVPAAPPPSQPTDTGGNTIAGITLPPEAPPPAKPPVSVGGVIWQPDASGNYMPVGQDPTKVPPASAQPKNTIVQRPDGSYDVVDENGKVIRTSAAPPKAPDAGNWTPLGEGWVVGPDGKPRQIYQPYHPDQTQQHGVTLTTMTGADGLPHEVAVDFNGNVVQDYGPQSQQPQVANLGGGTFATVDPVTGKPTYYHDPAGDVQTLSDGSIVRVKPEGGFEWIYRAPQRTTIGNRVVQIDPATGQSSVLYEAPVEPPPAWWTARHPNGPMIGDGEDGEDDEYDEESPVEGDGTLQAPPIDPPLVVGTGHRFGEPVSMEGVHKGVDLQAYKGTPVKSPVDGTVTSVHEEPKGLGLRVVITDEQGVEHSLNHLDSADVKPGDRVQAGQPVASVGSSGAGSTGAHLDYRQETPDGGYLDPTAALGPLAQLPRADDGGEPTGAGADNPYGPDMRGWNQQDAALARITGITAESQGGRPFDPANPVNVRILPLLPLDFIQRPGTGQSVGAGRDTRYGNIPGYDEDGPDPLGGVPSYQIDGFGQNDPLDPRRMNPDDTAYDQSDPIPNYRPEYGGVRADMIPNSSLPGIVGHSLPGYGVGADATPTPPAPTPSPGRMIFNPTVRLDPSQVEDWRQGPPPAPTPVAVPAPGPLGVGAEPIPPLNPGVPFPVSKHGVRMMLGVNGGGTGVRAQEINNPFLAVLPLGPVEPPGTGEDDDLGVGKSDIAWKQKREKYVKSHGGDREKIMKDLGMKDAEFNKKFKKDDKDFTSGGRAEGGRPSSYLKTAGHLGLDENGINPNDQVDQYGNVVKRNYMGTPLHDALAAMINPVTGRSYMDVARSPSDPGGGAMADATPGGVSGGFPDQMNPMGRAATQVGGEQPFTTNNLDYSQLQAQINYWNQLIANARQELQQNYDVANRQLDQQLQISGDQLSYQKAKDELDRRMHEQDNALQVQLLNMQQQFALSQTAYQNPWLQQLQGLAPIYGQPGGPNGGALPDWYGSALEYASTAGMPTAGVGDQLASAMGAPPSYQQWASATPFERAAVRTTAELSGAGGWQQFQNNLRGAWGQAGITGMPDTTRLTAAGKSPMDMLGTNQTVETFGQSPTDYWTQQNKLWGAANASGAFQKA